MSEKKDYDYTIKMTNSYSSIGFAVIVAFGMFWATSGWYRIDCALGVSKACELIAAEKEYHKPVEAK